MKCIRASKKDNWHAEFSIKRIRSFAKHLFCFHFGWPWPIYCYVMLYLYKNKIIYQEVFRLPNNITDFIISQYQNCWRKLKNCRECAWVIEPKASVIWPLSLYIIASPTFNLCMYNKERISWNKVRITNHLQTIFFFL